MNHEEWKKEYTKKIQRFLDKKKEWMRDERSRDECFLAAFYGSVAAGAVFLVLGGSFEWSSQLPAMSFTSISVMAGFFSRHTSRKRKKEKSRLRMFFTRITYLSGQWEGIFSSPFMRLQRAVPSNVSFPRWPHQVIERANFRSRTRYMMRLTVSDGFFPPIPSSSFF